MKGVLKKLLPFFIILLLTIPLYGQEAAKVLKVVDGDTIRISYKGREESIRLIGIDAPESKANKKAKSDAQRSGKHLKTIISQGEEATEFVKTIVRPGDKVTIEFDVQTRDKYRRLLCYVYLINGKMLNEEIMKARLCQSYDDTSQCEIPGEVSEGL